MRIAIIAPPWVPTPPPAYGGTEAVLDNLARGLEAAGHEVLLFATGDSTCPVPTGWVHPEALGTERISPAHELQQVVHAYDVIAEWGADVIHDHTLLGPLYADAGGTPVVTTNHGPFDQPLLDCYRAIARRVPLVAISEAHARSAGDVPVAAVIHHGVDVASFPVGDGDGGYALFLGRMNADKGVHLAIRIARAAGVPLKIAAKMREPAEIAYFEEAVRPLLGEGVELVGEVGGVDKLELLAGARCLLNPICWPEPFGMVMIEALACGTPVLATPAGSVPELVRDGVTGFVRQTETDLADQLLRVHELDRARCRQEAEERFSSARMVQDHLALYERVATPRRRTLEVA